MPHFLIAPFQIVAQRFGVEFRFRPVDERLGTVFLPIEIGAERRIAEVDSAFQRGVFKICRQVGKCDECRFGGVIEPHQAPDLRSALFPVWGEDEEEITVEAVELQLNHRFGEKFGHEEFLFRRVLFEAGNVTVKFSGAFGAAAVFRHPRRPRVEVVAFEECEEIPAQFRIIHQRIVEVNAVNIEIFSGGIGHKRLIIRREARFRNSAESDRKLRIARLVTEIGGLERRSVIPCAFDRVIDIRFVPEFPDGHLPLKFPRLLSGEIMECEQIHRQRRNGVLWFCPCGRVVIHAEDGDVSCLQKIGVGLVLPPLEYAGSGFRFTPMHSFADHRRAGTICDIGNKLESIRRKADVPIVGAGQPALRRIEREEALRIARPGGGVADDGETARPCEGNAVPAGEFQRVISTRQAGKLEFSFARIRPIPPAQFCALPVT